MSLQLLQLDRFGKYSCHVMPVKITRLGGNVYMKTNTRVILQWSLNPCWIRVIIMNIFSTKFILAASGVLFAGAASATTRSSFLDVDTLTGITFSSNYGGLSTVVSVGANPMFTIGSNTYHITGIIGFYALSDTHDLAETNSGFSANFGPWGTDNSNAGTGGIAGWRSNPNNGITLNHSETFTFQTLSSTLVDRVGFHVITQELFPNTSGNTGNIAFVPEPASFAVMGLGLLGICTRRRKK